MKNVFTVEKGIDTNKGIHVLGCSTNYSDGVGVKANKKYEYLDELERIYEAITGVRKSMKDLSGVFFFTHSRLKTENLKAVSGDRWKESYTDLLEIGDYYWLGGSSYDARYLYYVTPGGGINEYTNDYAEDGTTHGVRLVVSLRAGVELDKDDAENGMSLDTAYKIK